MADQRSYLGRVYVALKPTVNDPQGITVRESLRSLEFDSVTSVRVGKYLEIGLDAASLPEAEERIRGMCEQLLANPVIETFHFEVQELAAS